MAVATALIAAPAASAAPPGNDDFGAPVILGSGVPVASTGHTTAEATSQSGEPSATSPRSVWFTWTATAADVVAVDQCQDGADPSPNFVTVWTGSAVDALTEVPRVGGHDCVNYYRVAAGVHRIAVGNSNPGQSFDLAVRHMDTPANDNYANAMPVGPDLPVVVDTNNVNSTFEPNEPAAFPGAQTVWFRWQAPSAQQVRIDTCNFEYLSGSANRQIGIYTGGSLPATEIAANPYGAECDLTFTPVSGTTYRIAVAVYGEGNFTFRIRQTAPPGNDNFANRIDLGDDATVSVAGDNTFATRQGGEPTEVGGSANADRSVWYRWEAPSTGTFRFSGCPSGEDFSARISVYKNVALTALDDAGNRLDTYPGYNPYCRTKAAVTSGTTYIVEVASSDNSEDEGPFTLDIHPFAPPDNDALEGAIELGSALPVSTSGTTLDGSVEPGESNPPGTNGYVSVWYSWAPTVTEAVEIDVCGEGFEPWPSVWEGDEVEDLDLITEEEDDYSEIACPGSAEGTRLPFLAVAGHTYRIAVDAASNDEEGTFTLSIRDPSVVVPPPGGGTPTPGGTAKPPFNLKAALKKCKRKKGKKRKKCIKRAKKRAG
jgi:hypothetical protein